MQTNTKTNNHMHIPVLLNEVLLTLNPKQGESYLDCTAGYGGHAAPVVAKTAAPAVTTLVDRDAYAIEALKKRFQGTAVTIIKSDFLTASEDLSHKKQKFDLILADLGVSSPHLDSASRGFSIKEDGPLDMRMDQSQSLTAEDIVNSYSADELGDILRVYGEEPKARKIALLITEHRPIKSTHELARIVALAWPGHSKVHPATRTFQALRIAVNDELKSLERALPVWTELLAPGGRLAVISFHSLEDRIVKQFFADHTDSYDTNLVSLTKRPITASEQELVFNPRARSAKLRAVAKIKK